LSGTKSFEQSYILRRKKEFLPLLVVRFFHAYDAFNLIYRDYQKYRLGTEGTNAQPEQYFFERTKHLEESLFLDIEAKSRFLFRQSWGTNTTEGEIRSKYDDLIADLTYRSSPVNDSEVSNTFSQLRKSLLSKSLDTNIRKILHILTLLKVNFHELEHYDVEYAQEHEYVVKIEALFAKLGRALEENEKHELDHVKEIDKMGRKIVNDTENHIRIAMQRCKSLFRETSEILLHVIQESRKNEVLVLNLLREIELVDRIYGFKAHERIFSRMYASMPNLGHTGLEKAINYCRYNCNNTAGLPEVMDHLPTDSTEGSELSKDNLSFKKTAGCYFLEKKHSIVHSIGHKK
jgi:hypothetical protein